MPKAAQKWQLQMLWLDTLKIWKGKPLHLSHLNILRLSIQLIRNTMAFFKHFDYRKNRESIELGVGKSLPELIGEMTHNTNVCASYDWKENLKTKLMSQPAAQPCANMYTRVPNLGDKRRRNFITYSLGIFKLRRISALPFPLFLHCCIL